MLTVPLKQGVGQHANEAVAIARGASVGARFALARNADARIVVHARGNTDIGYHVAQCLPTTVAGGASLLDDRSLPVARGTRGLHADYAG